MTDASAAPNILISRVLPDEAVRLARSRPRVDIHDGEAPLRKPELAARLKGRQGLICLITDQIDDELLAGCPDLRVVANVAVGFNNRVHPGLLGLTNVVLAPHIASSSHDTRFKMATLAVDNCLAVLEGKVPPTPVNPEVLLVRRK